MTSKRSRLDQLMAASPNGAMKNLDTLFDHIVTVSNEAVRRRITQAKISNAAKRKRRAARAPAGAVTKGKAKR